MADHVPQVAGGLVGAKVPLSKMCGSHWMNLSGQDGDVWKLLDYRISSMRRGEEAEEDDMSGLDSVLYQHPHCLNHSVSCTEDWVHEQHFSSVHIWGEFGVIHLCFLCLLVTLDEDLANSDGAAAVPKALLHSLTTPHYADSTVASFKLDTFILVPCRCGHSALWVWQLIQTLFNYQSDQSISTKHKVSPAGCFVSDYSL